MPRVTRAAIIGLAEKPNVRHIEPGADVNTYLRDAVAEALRDAEVKPSEVDGFGVFAFGLDPDKAVDLAWRLGLSLRWVVQATHGGASAINNLAHAARAIEAGDASVIVLVCGDAAGPGATAAYNRARRDHLGPLGYGGPNSLFAMLTQRQMKAFGLAREDYGHVAIAQRAWAAGNPNAAYREPLTMAEYLDAQFIADPLTRYDCPPSCSGASAIVLAAPERCARGGAPVLIRSVAQCYNYDNQDGDGLRTGLSKIARELWEGAGIEPKDADLAGVYDDYPAMVLAQLNDLGLVPGEDLKKFVGDKIATRAFPVNTSGGLLSAGQAGGSASQLALVEVARQLQHRAGERQVANARFGVATGYGQVLYRYGAASSAVVLERGSPA